MENSNLSIGEAGSMLMGAGLATLSANVNIGLTLVGVGVALKVMVAVLQKKGLDIKDAPNMG